MSGCGYVGGAVQRSVEATTSCTSCYMSIGVWRTPLLPQSGVASHCTDAIVLGSTNDATTERTAQRPAGVEQRHFSRGPHFGNSCGRKYASHCQCVGLRICVGACNLELLEEQCRIARQSDFCPSTDLSPNALCTGQGRSSWMVSLERTSACNQGSVLQVLGGEVMEGSKVPALMSSPRAGCQD